MKILLTTLNSKYIHSNLAVRYLKSFCDSKDVFVKEYTINDGLGAIISDIYKEKPDIVAFSCYIWNIEEIKKVIATLKSANGNIKILLGGPEVSYNPVEFMSENNEVDYIIFGEGENTFKEFIYSFNNNEKSFDIIDGLCYRDCNKIIMNRERQLIKDLDQIKFPYDDLESLKNKIVYYESSRGCPFNCQYCLSSTIHGVRYFSMDRVKEDLKKFIDAKVSQVKFVDRTFNCDLARTKEIFKFIIEQNPSDINFHFEIAGDLLDGEIIDMLKDVPEGLFQFEIGVQSTNQESLKIICRNNNFDKIKQNVNKILANNNIHIHLDLIAGLPKEDYQSFGQSFDHVYNLQPHMLQLGFLKLLRGSGLREKALEYGIKFNNYTPYEVISTDDLNFEQILRLKDIEELLEKYYNSNRFNKSLTYIIGNFYKSPFSFYEAFSKYWRDNSLYRSSHSLKNLYTILIEFYKQNCRKDTTIINELLKFDYLYNERSYILPEGIEREEIRDYGFEFLKDEENIKKYLSSYNEMTPKQIIKRVHFEKFKIDVFNESIDKDEIKKEVFVLFDYHVDARAIRRSKLYKM